MEPGKRESRPGLARSSLEAAALCAAALALGFGVNATRSRPLPAFGPVPHTAESCAAPAVEDPKPVPFIDPRLAFTRHGTPAVLFVDARPRADFQQAHIAGAISMPADEPLPEATQPPLAGSRLVIVYCDRPQCGLSTRLAQRLRERGLGDVRVLAEGWWAWSSAGYPAQSGGF